MQRPIHGRRRSACSIAMGEGVGNWDGHKTLKEQYSVHAPILAAPGRWPRRFVSFPPVSGLPLPAVVAVFALAALTDWLDGWIARRYHQYSAFGEVVSGMEVADKIAAAPRGANDRPNRTPPHVLVVGAGIIGLAHMGVAQRSLTCTLSAIVDPAPAVLPSRPLRSRLGSSRRRARRSRAVCNAGL